MGSSDDPAENKNIQIFIAGSSDDPAENKNILIFIVGSSDDQSEDMKIFKLNKTQALMIRLKT